MGERTCSIDGCDRTESAGRLKRGMCGLHYQRLMRYGSIGAPPRVYRYCEGPDCNRRAGTSGLCSSHYKQQYLGKELTPLRVSTWDLGRPDVCEFPGCGRPHKARGLCKAHRDQASKGQRLRPVAEYSADRVCSEPGCSRRVIARGLCSPDYQFFHYELARYGIKASQYKAMHAAQGGVCAICRGTNANGYRLSIDHDHSCCPGGTSCGRCVRGLLCGRCNFFIGHADDDPSKLRAGADYLDLHSERKASRAM